MSKIVLEVCNRVLGPTVKLVTDGIVMQLTIAEANALALAIIKLTADPEIGNIETIERQ